MTEPTCWRVLTVEEDDGFFKITAVAYRPDKYCYIERGDPLETKVIPDFTTPPNPPTSITAQELQYELNGTVATKIYLSWPSVVGVNTYKVKWRQSAGVWTEVTAYGPSYDILNVTGGTYEIEVYSISPFGIVSTTAATTTITISGAGEPPVNPGALTIVPLTATTATLSWPAATDLDVTVGGQVLIRHDPRTVPTANWDDANPVIAAVPGSATNAIVPLLTGTYFIKFQDQSGGRSGTASSVHTTLPTPQPVLVVNTWAEESLVPPFSGTAANMSYVAGDGGLVLNTAGGLTGDYRHQQTFDLGGIYAVNLRRYLVTDSKIVSGTPPNLDVDESKTYFRTANTNPSSPGGVTWSAWTEYVHAVVECRALQLRVVSETTSADVATIVKNLGATAELQQRSTSGEGSGFSSYNVFYANSFYQTPSITITPQNMQSGDYYTITLSTRKGFLVEFRDFNGNLAVRDFTYTATGYGSQIDTTFEAFGAGGDFTINIAVLDTPDYFSNLSDQVWGWDRDIQPDWWAD